MCISCIFTGKRHTISRPNTLSELEFYVLAKNLFDVKSIEDLKIWVNRFTDWVVKHERFLIEVTYDENRKLESKHEKLKNQY